MAPETPTCGAHEHMVENDAQLLAGLSRVETNTEWIKSGLKYGLGLIGTVVTVIVLPFGVYFISLEKRLDAQDNESKARITACEQKVKAVEHRVAALEGK